MRVVAVLLPIVLAVGPPAPGVAQIVLPGTQPGDLVNWPILLPDAVCRICHSEYAAEDYEPWDTWSGSMMANSARDPLFWAAVDIANQDVPGSGEFCIRCHSPRAWLAGRSLPADGSAFEGSPGVPGNTVQFSDYEGVDCQFCHRLYEGAAGTPFEQNGQYWVDDGDPVFEPPMRGPYADAESPAHSTLFSGYHRSSRSCAVCHNLRNPLVNLLDENGADTGLLFPEQLTYDEWAQSRFPGDGIECQTCHMPPVPGFGCVLQFPERDEVPQHHLAGANAWMSGVLKNLYGTGLEREAAFDRAINLALDNLQNESAELRVNAPSRADEGDVLDMNVVVTNLTGHKLPTGYPEGRRMWLHVEVRDALGTTLYESGRYDDASANLVPDPDVKIYETIHGTHAGGAGFHLVLNDRIFKDNRIPPAGFVPDASTMPVGATFKTLADGSLANWDVTGYSFSVPPGAYSPLAVTASLYYQTASREYIEFLRDENTTGPDPQDPDPQAPSRGDKIFAYWQDDPSPPILMRTQTRRIHLDAAPPLAAIAPEPPTPLVRSASRNPFRDRTELEYWIPEGGAAARLTVYDVAGRRVRALVDRDLDAGSHRVEWNGRTDAGGPAATGSYFVRLDVDGHAAHVKRVILMR